MKLCRHCGAPITASKMAGGWLHSRPLGLFRLSHAEYADIVNDPPRYKEALHRQTYIHPAQPARS